MRLILGFLTATIISFALSPAIAEEMRRVDVRFAPGSSGTTLSDTIIGYDSVLYQVGAEAGQTMRVALSPSNAATYFNVYAPGRGPGDEALASGQLTDPLNSWTGELPTSGEYTVSVYMMRSAARREERSTFSIDISIEGAVGSQVQGDFADGLQGGPDFFEVVVSGRGSLNVRTSPSAGAPLVTQLASGESVRNLGCRMAEGRRWCRIATLADPGFEGWSAGEFLVEGTGAAVQLPAAAPARGSGEERLRFAPGTTGSEISGSLGAGESRRYVIGANAGQEMYVRIAPRNQPISYQIFNPDRTFLLDLVTSDQEYRGELWQSGDHVIEVVNRTNSAADFNIIVGIE